MKINKKSSPSNLKTGDRVKIITGKEKGTEGFIKSFDRKANKVILEGVNMKTHFPKSKSNGSIIQKESGIHISNIMILNENNKIVRSDKNKFNRELLLKANIESKLNRENQEATNIELKTVESIEQNIEQNNKLTQDDQVKKTRKKKGDNNV